MKTNTTKKTEERWSLRCRGCEMLIGCSHQQGCPEAGRATCVLIGHCNKPHQPDQTSDWREKPKWEKIFDNNIPQLNKERLKNELYIESKLFSFGYEYFENGEIYQVIDWSNIKSFIRTLLIEKDELLSSQEKRHQREIEEVIKKVWKKLDGLDCGFCNYGNEVKERLDQISQSIKERK